MTMRADLQECREAYHWGTLGLVSRYYDHECECCGMDGYIKETFEGGPLGHLQNPEQDFRFFYKDVEPDAHRISCINCDWELGQPRSEDQRQECERCDGTGDDLLNGAVRSDNGCSACNGLGYKDAA